MEHGDTQNTDERNESPNFSRVHMSGHVELRVLVPRDVINVIDAEVLNRGGEGAGVYRATIVNEVMGPWAKKKLHDATVLLRVAGSNPTGSASNVQELRVVGEVSAK